MVKITGLDKLQRQLREAEQAGRDLNGVLAEVSFDPGDPSSVESAIAEAKQAVDQRVGHYSGNPLVEQIADAAKANFEERLFKRVEEWKLANPVSGIVTMAPTEVALKEVRDAVSDLRRADYQTFDRHAQKLSRLLSTAPLKELAAPLTEGLDIDAWLAAGERTQSSMVGSAKLEWPAASEAQLGLTILLAHRFGGNSREALNFAHTFYYNGSKISANLQHMVSQVFVPFERDFRRYVEGKVGEAPAPTQLPLEQTPKYPRRIFIVHGHDGGPREALARFLTQLQFEVIILHEQPNKGRTIIEKFEEHADVGFAVVLFTPDDIGGAKDQEQKPRPRQNVVLELGYFIGKLGRERVLALKRGEMELPSDFLGVAYTELDGGEGWKVKLAKELEAAGYAIDWRAAAGVS